MSRRRSGNIRLWPVARDYPESWGHHRITMLCRYDGSPPEPANDNTHKVWRDFVEGMTGRTWAEFQRIAPYLPRRRHPTWPQLKAYIDRGGKYPLELSDPWPFGWLH